MRQPHTNHPSSPHTMLNLRQDRARARNLLIDRNDDRRRSDFDFWGDQTSKVYDDYSDEAADYRPRTRHDNDHNGSYSPPFHRGTSPLFPCNHNCCYQISPRSRTRAIPDGKREMMKMIKDMPESSYELSLKDIVEQKDIEVDVKSLKLTKQNKKSLEGRQIARSKSMESGNFLLKIFFPFALGSKKKQTSKSSSFSKISPRTSLEGAKKTVDKGWRKTRMDNSEKTSSKGNRNKDVNFPPRCRSFLTIFRWKSASNE